jgi:hypothetical protein
VQRSSRLLKNSETSVASTPETTSVIEQKENSRVGPRSHQPQILLFWVPKSFFSSLLEIALFVSDTAILSMSGRSASIWPLDQRLMQLVA